METVRVLMLRDHWAQRDGRGHSLRWRSGQEYSVSVDQARTFISENPPAAKALDLLPSTPHRDAKAAGGPSENKMIEPAQENKRKRGRPRKNRGR